MQTSSLNDHANRRGSYAFFAPGIIQSYGYSQIGTQLHSVPPWACAFVFAMIIAFFSDKTKHRFAFTLIPIFVAISGFAILLTVHNKPHTQYAALFLVAMGSYSAMPVIVCWFNMNLGGHHRRAVGTAWQIGFGTQRLMKHNLNRSADVQLRKHWWNYRNFVRFYLGRPSKTSGLKREKQAHGENQNSN